MVVRAEFQELAYKTIEAMPPHKQFTHRLLIGIVGLDEGEQPKNLDGAALRAIVRADQEGLIFVCDVKPLSRRAGWHLVWERYDDAEDDDA